jgi:hypothetical protein
MRIAKNSRISPSPHFSAAPSTGFPLRRRGSLCEKSAECNVLFTHDRAERV